MRSKLFGNVRAPQLPVGSIARPLPQVLSLNGDSVSSTPKAERPDPETCVNDGQGPNMDWDHSSCLSAFTRNRECQSTPGGNALRLASARFVGFYHIELVGHP